MGHQLSPEDRRLLQLEELKIWQDFHCFCEKNNLTYYFTAGSLLGAVRHKGFIPWDDDIDIAMPRKDYDRTADLWAKEPIAGYCFQNSFTEPNFPYYFSKIRKHGTEVYEPFFSKINMHKGIYIDIFPLDPCPSIESLAKLYFKAMEVITSAISSQVNPDFSCGYRKWYMLFLYHIFRRIPHLFLSAKDFVQSAEPMVTPTRRITQSGFSIAYFFLLKGKRFLLQLVGMNYYAICTVTI